MLPQFFSVDSQLRLFIFIDFSQLNCNLKTSEQEFGPHPRHGLGCPFEKVHIRMNTPGLLEIRPSINRLIQTIV